MAVHIPSFPIKGAQAAAGSVHRSAALKSNPLGTEISLGNFFKHLQFQNKVRSHIDREDGSSRREL